MSLTGRVAIVLGGAQGIGRAVCDSLLAQGAKVVCSDIKGDAARAACVELKKKYGDKQVVHVQGDMANTGQVERAFQVAKATFGPPNIVVPVAGKVDEFDWKSVLELNLGGSINATNMAMKYMSKKEGGVGGDLVLMSSVFGLTPSLISPVYGATRHAVVGLARSWGDKSFVAETGVRVNSICPWLTDTALLDCLVVPGTTQPSPATDKLKQTPWMKPAVVGEALLKLLQDGVSGQALIVTQSKVDYAAFPEVDLD